MFAAAKDAMASKAAQTYVNGVIARYGRLQDLKIDSRNKTLVATCLLQGESQPITIQVDRYVIESVGAKKFIRLEACTCSRPWIQNLLADFAQNKQVELPAWAASAL